MYEVFIKWLNFFIHTGSERLVLIYTDSDPGPKFPKKLRSRIPRLKMQNLNCGEILTPNPDPFPEYGLWSSNSNEYRYGSIQIWIRNLAYWINKPTVVILSEFPNLEWT
jgi:hypothetical protein